ncbi:MAG: HAMP domain-containing histidine kinase [Lentisphaerae bacterium]|nr:HAMP domain-containing histidine kinase [Lentisphaerota bacterium]
MKSRLTLALLGLVIFSTALLTLVAARSLQQDEIIAQRHIDERADKAVRTVTALMQGRLQGELDQVRNAMADAVAAGGDLRDVRTMAVRLEHSRALVQRVYLYMNPWGFMWPAEPAVDVDDVHRREALLAVLRGLTAGSAATDGTPFGIRLNGSMLLFGAMENRQGLYVGYEIAPGAFGNLLVSSLRATEGGGILLGAEGDGLKILPGGGTEPGHVLVEDSLGQRQEVGMTRPGPDVLPRAQQALDPPLDAIRIAAYSDNPDEIRRTVAVRSQLYRWGIVMLALGILGGAGLLLGEARAEINRARSGSDVALGVSHDLRTPIASMRILAESMYLGHVPDPARQREFLRIIVEECERLSQLTERVLFLFRFGQDAMQYHLRPADLKDAVQKVVDAFLTRYVTGDGENPGASPSRPDIRFEVADSIPPVKLDPAAFSQVVLNLLDNAVKYGKRSAAAAGGAGGVATSPRIEIHLFRQDRRRRLGWPRRTWAVLSVRDFGSGIPRRHQRRIFHRFYRVPEARDENVSGVGLGLSVCKHVMDGHGGWIALHSAPGVGTTFTLYLPAEEGAV